MKKFISAIILTLIGVFAFAGPMANPTFADDICGVSGVSAEVKAAAGCGGSSQTLPGAIQIILNAVIAIAGIIAAIFVVVGGIKYMTSAGDPRKIEEAKKTILYACIGIIVCALSFAIVNWTIGIVNQSSGGSEDGAGAESTALSTENPLAFLEK